MQGAPRPAESASRVGCSHSLALLLSLRPRTRWRPHVASGTRAGTHRRRARLGSCCCWPHWPARRVHCAADPLPDCQQDLSKAFLLLSRFSLNFRSASAISKESRKGLDRGAATMPCFPDFQFIFQHRHMWCPSWSPTCFDLHHKLSSSSLISAASPSRSTAAALNLSAS